MRDIVKTIQKAEKRQSLAMLKKKLDKVFSIYIRKRDSEYGISKCITCNTRKEWKYMDNGHYIKRKELSTRYDERNCNAQCQKCNWLEQGADARYKIAIDKKWGAGTSEKLEQKKNNKVKWTPFEYIFLIEKYEKLNNRFPF